MAVWLALIFDAPLMSFGGPMIDQHGVTRDMPGRAMLTGLLGNALGYDHREADKLEKLQSRLVHATLSLRPGDRFTDFHTVDLGQPFLRAGWTTRGIPQGREGGTAATGTHIRYRQYLASALRLVVLTLDPAAESPTIEELGNAVEQPARPLFLGRKTCLPARPILAGRFEAGDPVSALMEGHSLILPQLENEPGDLADLRAEWPLPTGTSQAPLGCRIETVIDMRDWSNQFHGGERLVALGLLPISHRRGVDG
ncbi:MAG: type I-E CRISPR-associated protein Cas5/CasD [Parvibaculum sp.]|uniref:type I-E CRISPR-associated protein Cas5/CasD n=1 Tax=Parvibaculum sp. TaxID=2024848 RepID=UPI003C769B83